MHLPPRLSIDIFLLALGAALGYTIGAKNGQVIQQALGIGAVVFVRLWERRRQQRAERKAERREKRRQRRRLRDERETEGAERRAKEERERVEEDREHHHHEGVWNSACMTCKTRLEASLFVMPQQLKPFVSGLDDANL
ncbi:hypothetical protein V8C34DRAFT_177307 [Trichoderma compactum]